MAMTPCATAASVSFFPARPAASARAGAGVAARAAAGGGGEGSGSSKWWAPLLGWSGKADYIEAPAPAPAAPKEGGSRAAFVGGLTEEKARELRARMAQTESFHDAMYHSAIASRLARSSA